MRRAEDTSSAASAAIHTSGLTKRYGQQLALSGLSMTVPRGEVFGFLGPNGAGKTTAVKLLLGLIGATSGQAWLLGRPAGPPRSRRKVGYLPELFRYQAWLSAREVMALHQRLAAADGGRAERDSILELVGLKGRGDDRLGSFSKGMQQRLGLGVSLIGNPDLIFLDEPTSALDPVGRVDVRQIIHHLREAGATVFLNSHLLTEVEMVCDRVAMVDHGRVIATGTLDELLGGGACRFRVTGLDPSLRRQLTRWGEVDDDGQWVSVRGLEPERVPEVVQQLVEWGGRVYAVESRHQTLEDRFLQLLGGPES